MLSKLLKHEFRATGRIMLPMTGILLIMSVAANASTRHLMDTGVWFFNLLGGLLITAFGFAVVGVFAVAFVLMIQRFYKNLLQDEGYVMLTLPVSIHQHIWAKLIVSAVWFVVTTLAVILAGCIVAFDVGFIKIFFQGLGEVLRELRDLRAYYAVNGAALLAELIALTFLGLVAMCLQFYAALAAGHSLPSHKMAWSVVWFFGLQFVTQIVGFSLIYLLDVTGFFNWGAELFNIQFSGMSGMHVGMLMLIAGTVIYGAVFYLITTFFLKKRLNLE